MQIQKKKGGRASNKNDDDDDNGINWSKGSNIKDARNYDKYRKRC
jgi:hypothetical protein